MIGKPVPRIDGRAKVTGKAIYSDDLILPRTMYAKVLHAKYAHAKILRIDTEKAKALPGVVAVYTAKDIKFNDKYFRMGNTHDTWVLAEDYVCYIGDMLAFVVAEEEEIAEEALDLIEVDYEELPVVSHLKDAYQAENLARSDKPGNVGMPLVVERGEVEKDFAEATVFASGKYTYPSLHQLHLEPNSATAVYELGKLTVYCASQVWFHIREDISAVTGIPEKDIEIKPMCIGGAFGARNDQPLPVFTALLATMVKGTVKMTNSRLEEFLACRPSVGMEIEITLAADSEGNFLSKKIKLLSGFGAYSSDSDAVTAIACFRADNNYRFRSAYAEATGLYLNHAPTGAYRGFGNPQMHFALEQTIDKLAVKLNMDPTELRMKNFMHAYETTIHGFKPETNGIKECMAKAKELMNWDEKKKHKVKGKGIGVAALIHCAGSRAGKPEFAGSSALLRLESSGALTVLIGESEIGQGMNTVCAQIVAQELGVDPMKVNVVMGDTSLTPFSTGTNGSKLTTNLGNAVLHACKDLKQQLTGVLRERIGTGPVVVKDGNIYGEYTGEHVMSLEEAAAKACYANNGSPFLGIGVFEPKAELGDMTGYGNLAPAYPFGIQMAEVTVHDDGSFTVDKIVSVHDIGRVINTQMAHGQVYGGVMQGMAAAVTEDLAINKEGVYQANTILEYKPPTIIEMPELVSSFVETIDPYGPYGAKCIAEPPIISVAPAIANALYDACGIRFDKAPITPAEVRKKLMEKQRNANADKEA